MFGARAGSRRRHADRARDTMENTSPKHGTTMRMGRLRKIVAAVALVGAVAVVAIFAAAARPSTTTYCSCTLSYNGTPAVSSTQYFTSNHVSLFLANNWHVYLYNTSTGNQTCDASGYDTYGGGSGACSNTATARCQLLPGYGVDDSATCWADY
jgi:hypothetical protein